jgi:Secretion system C-terminal sorting domain/SdrD B-like domain
LQLKLKFIHLKIKQQQMKKNFLSLCLTTIYFVSQAQVSGLAFRDYNGNGTKDATAASTDEGLMGVTVTAYSSTDAVIATTITDVNGMYSFTAGQIASGTPVRIEFMKPASAPLLSSAQSGGSYGSAVQFVMGGATNVNAAFNTAKDYAACTDATLFIPELWSKTDPTVATQPALRKFNESFNGTTANTIIATQGEIGNTWGIAVDRANKFIYAATFFRKFSYFGPGGQDAIYKISAGVDGTFGTADDTKSIFIELDTYFGANSTGTNLFATKPDGDSLFVGKAAYGDIEISADGTKLYAMNLADRKIYIIPINAAGTAPTAGTITTSPAIPSSANCPTGLSRGFGLAVKGDDGKVLVSAVCDAASRYLEIWEYNPVANTWSAAPVANLDVEASGTYYTNSGCCATSWNSTGAGYEAQWMAMGLDVSPDGSVLNYSYVNRRVYTGQSTRNVGNVIRFYKSGATYLPENAGVANGLTGYSTTNGEGPGGGEFINDGAVDGSNLSAIGANLVIPGRKTSVIAYDDPIITYSSGIRLNENSNGAILTNYEVEGVVPGYSGGYAQDIFDGKKNNLGDLEFLCAVAPIEVGNRFWLDSDADGIQDPGEPGVAGARIAIYACTDLTFSTPLGIVTTDANGNYYFSSGTGVSGTGITYGVNLASNTCYNVRVLGTVNPANGEIQGNGGTAVFTNTNPTLPNITGNGTADWSDNDGIKTVVGAATFLVAQITTGAGSTGNHTVDFGIRPGTSLPVKFLSFTAKKQNNISVLNFEIAQASTGSIFTIERSANAINFSAIGSVNGTNATSYSYNDVFPSLNIKNYYRIKEIDAQGKVSYSEVRMVRFVNDTKVDIYPIPASNVLNITLGGELVNKTLVIKLTNSIGQIVLTQKVTNASSTENIDISKLVNGTYQLSILNNNTTVVNKKITILQ